MITTLITLGIIFWLFYYLFIKGVGYPILFLIFGIYGGNKLITGYFPESNKTIMTFMSYGICYATFIAALISVLAIGFIMEKINDK